MISINQRIDKLGEKNNYAFYASLFRLFICFHLLKKIILSWQYISLLYKSTSFLPPSPTYLLEMINIDTMTIRSHYEIFISFYIVVILLYFFGIGKHFTALLLYILYELQQRMCHLVLNGGDNLLKFIMLYMIFVDSYKYFVISKIQYKNSKIRYFSNVFSNLGGISVCLHLCMAYFLSGWHKVHADVWFNGVATYYTLSLERFKGTPFNEMLVKNGAFVTITTYYTMLVEIYFPVLIWFKKTKKVISLAAISLHIGIYVFMMIYDFQIVFIMVQGFFFSNEKWIRLINKYKRKIQNLKEKFKKKLPHEYKQTYSATT